MSKRIKFDDEAYDLAVNKIYECPRLSDDAAKKDFFDAHVQPLLSIEFLAERRSNGVDNEPVILKLIELDLIRFVPTEMVHDFLRKNWNMRTRHIYKFTSLSKHYKTNPRNDKMQISNGPILSHFFAAPELESYIPDDINDYITADRLIKNYDPETPYREYKRYNLYNLAHFYYLGQFSRLPYKVVAPFIPFFAVHIYNDTVASPIIFALYEKNNPAYAQILKPRFWYRDIAPLKTKFEQIKHNRARDYNVSKTLYDFIRTCEFYLKAAALRSSGTRPQP